MVAIIIITFKINKLLNKYINRYIKDQWDRLVLVNALLITNQITLYIIKIELIMDVLVNSMILELRLVEMMVDISVERVAWKLDLIMWRMLQDSQHQLLLEVIRIISSMKTDYLYKMMILWRLAL